MRMMKNDETVQSVCDRYDQRYYVAITDIHCRKRKAENDLLYAPQADYEDGIEPDTKRYDILPEADERAGSGSRTFS